MYKKFLLIFLSIFILCGCERKSDEMKLYENYILDLRNQTKFDENLPFDIEISISKITDSEVKYKAIIDNPKKNLKNIEAIIIHDKYTEDIYPSSGIFDDKYNLILNEIDKENNNVKGIILVGYIPFDKDIKEFDSEFKVLFSYENDSGNREFVFYSTKK